MQVLRTAQETYGDDAVETNRGQSFRSKNFEVNQGTL